MSERFIPLTCQNCGGKLDVYDDMERFACGYCGAEMIVQRRGGTVALKKVTEAIKQVQVDTEKTAAELALVRLGKELTELTARQATIEAQIRERNKGFIEEQFDEGDGEGCLALIIGGPFIAAFWALHLMWSAICRYIFGDRDAWDWLDGERPTEPEARELEELRSAIERIRSQIGENKRIVGSGS